MCSGSHLGSHLLPIMEQPYPCCSLMESTGSTMPWILVPAPPGMGLAPWGSPGILCHLPTFELLISSSPMSLVLFIFSITSPPFPEHVFSPVLREFQRSF